MIKPRMAGFLALLAAFSAGWAVLISLAAKSSSMTILDHAFRFPPAVFLTALAAALAVLTGSWRLLSRLEVRTFGVISSEAEWGNLATFLPFAFFLLSPLLLTSYTDRNDFRLRLLTLAAAALLAFALLQLLHWKRHWPVDRWADRFGSIPPRTRLVILFAAAFTVYNLCTYVLVAKGVSFSGDEPYYLLTTHSLYQDRDINVANNYAHQDYFHFYSKEDNPRLRLGMYAREGKKGDRFIYPISMPGISILMLPFYWLSRLFDGTAMAFILKGSLSIWAVLLGIQLYLFSRERWGREKLSLELWFLYSFTAPVLFYAVHLYPEIPIAFLTLFIFRKVSSSRAPTRGEMLIMGLFLASFLWFGLKYNMIFWPLLLVTAYLLLRKHRVGWRVLLFLIPPFLSTALFYLFIYALYGTFSPLAIYEGVMSADRLKAFQQTILRIPFRLRLDTLLDYFFDQRDGLLLYSPLYIFAFAGLVEMFRKARKELWLILFIVLPYIINYAFFTHRQGYSPQGRILAPVSWAAVILVGGFLAHNRKAVFSFLFGLTGLLSLASAGYLLAHPFFLYQPTTHDVTARAGEMFVSLSNLKIFLPALLPSFIKVDNSGYLPNYFWILALAAFVLFYIFFFRREGNIGRPFRLLFTAGLMSAVFVLWALFPRTVLYQTRVFSYSPQRSVGYSLFPMGRGVVAKNNAELYLHREGDYKIVYTTRHPLQNLRVTFGSEKGAYETRFSLFDLQPINQETSFGLTEVSLEPSAFLRSKTLYLYEFNLNIRHLSSESMAVDPFFFQAYPVR